MNKKLVLLILVVVVVILGVWLWQSSVSPVSNESVGLAPSAADTSTSIDQDLQSVNVGSLDTDFKTIDSDLQSL